MNSTLDLTAVQRAASGALSAEQVGRLPRAVRRAAARSVWSVFGSDTAVAAVLGTTVQRARRLVGARWANQRAAA